MTMKYFVVDSRTNEKIDGLLPIASVKPEMLHYHLMRMATIVADEDFTKNFLTPAGGRRLSAWLAQMNWAVKILKE